MKNLILIASLTIFSFINLNGQWYVEKYNVTDINFLTREQLEMSLAETKSKLLTSGGVALLGGVFYLVSKYGDNSVGPDDSWFDQLLGEKGKKALAKSAGIGMMAGGTICTIVYAGRRGRINSVIRRNYPTSGLIELSPAIIPARSTASYYTGLAIKVTF